MSEAGDNNQPSKQKASYLAIWSLVLSICGVCCFLEFFIIQWVIIEYLACCIGILAVACCALSSLLGIGVLIQRSQRDRRLWWLAIVGIGISAISIILSVTWAIVALFWLLPK